MNLNHLIKYQICALPGDVARLKAAGYYDEASELIDKKLEDARLKSALKYSMLVQKEKMHRLAEHYPYTRDEALAIIREKISDFTEKEFEDYVSAGLLGWIYVNGEKRYFGRFFGTLCKTDPEFADRAGVQLPAVESAAQVALKGSVLNRSMDTMKSKGRISQRIRVKAELRLNDSAFKAGSRLRAWLPIPAECDSQSEIEIIKVYPETGKISSPDALQRTVCWDEVCTGNHEFSVEYSFIRTAKYTDTENMKDAFDSRPDFSLEEKAPHIMFTAYVRELAESVTENIDNPLEKARAIYDYITLNMKYTFMPDYFVLDSISDSAARNLTGDCGVLALLFITMCRYCGIPAAWESGLMIQPGFIGAHDWARFYVAPYGWLYADPSFGIGSRRACNEERRKFYFGNTDAYRMAANREFMADFEIPMEGFRADPFDNQLGEMELDGTGLEYGMFSRSKTIISLEEI